MWQKRSNLNNKFGAKKISCNFNHPHPSALEASVCAILTSQNSIELIQTQKKVYLSEARIGYIPDFYCRDLHSGKEFFVEAKGFETESWAIKLKLYRVYGPLCLQLFKGTALRPFKSETIEPVYGRSTLLEE